MSVQDSTARKNNVTDGSMPAWVAHGSMMHLHYAVMKGWSSDAYQTYPWLDTSTEPRVKPWVVALKAKAHLGSEIPSIPTRQTKRATARVKNWKGFKVTKSDDQNRIPRRERRAAARTYPVRA